MQSLIFLRFYIFFLIFIDLLALCVGQNIKKRADEIREDNGETSEEFKEESIEIPVENEANNVTCTRRLNNQMHEIQAARNKQFPFMAAIMSHQNEYICAGAVVSNGLILTTAKCTEQPMSYVLLNATKAKKDSTTVSLHVTIAEKFPTYIGGDVSKDIALVHTEKHNSSIASKIRLSNYTSYKSVVDFEALGFGLNSDVGQIKELQYIGLENRGAYERGELIRGYFDCIDTKVVTCFKDTGGPVIFDNELIGVITTGQDVCTNELTSKYALNKKMLEALPTYIFKAWLDAKIKKNEEKESITLPSYPVKPVIRKAIHQMTSSVKRSLISECTFIILLCFTFIMFY